MIKLRNMLIAVIAITALSTSAFAGSIGLGLTGSYAMIEASGTETDDDADTDINNSTSVANNAAVASFFVEYNFNFPLTVGFDMVPGSADVSASRLSRNDKEGSKDGVEVTPIAGNTIDTRTASAEVENVHTYYAEYTLFNGFYAKAGITEMDVITTETMAAAVKYGNTSVDGAMYGFGYKNDFGNKGFYKVEVTQTDFDTLSLKSTGNLATGSIKTVKADLDVTRANFSLGFKF